MLQAILQYFSLAFPHTFARLAYWRLLLFYDNTGLLDPYTVIVAILPSCIYFIDGFAAAFHFHDDDDDEGPLEHRLGSFRVVNDYIRYWFLVYKVFDLIAALDVVLRASGFCGKALLAIDFLVESTLVLLAKTIFFVSVGVFVGAALEGFPYLKNFLISVWMSVQLVILDLQILLEELFEREEVPADEPLLEEEVF